MDALVTQSKSAERPVPEQRIVEVELPQAPNSYAPGISWTTVSQQNSATYLHHRLETGGILEFQLLLDTSPLNENEMDLLPYVAWLMKE